MKERVGDGKLIIISIAVILLLTIMSSKYLRTHSLTVLVSCKC